MFCTFTLVLSEVRVQFPMWLLSVVPDFVLSRYVAQLFSEWFWDGTSFSSDYWYHFRFYFIIIIIIIVLVSEPYHHPYYDHHVHHHITYIAKTVCKNYPGWIVLYRIFKKVMACKLSCSANGDQITSEKFYPTNLNRWKHLGRPRYEDNIKKDFQEVGREAEDWIYMFWVTSKASSCEPCIGSAGAITDENVCD